MLRRDAVAVFKKKSQRVPARRKFKTVVTSSAGYPLDKTDYQTIKGMVTPMDILEPGGALIVASACSEGFGSKEFRAAQRRLIELGPDKFLATLTAKSLARSIALSGDPCIAVIPEGPYVVPYCDAG